MGKALNNTEVPVVKGTSGIILFPQMNRRGRILIHVSDAQSAFQPVHLNLEPFLLMTLSEKGMFERAESERITDCMECGSCSYTCPAGRPLLDYIRLGKVNGYKDGTRTKYEITSYKN